MLSDATVDVCVSRSQIANLVAPFVAAFFSRALEYIFLAGFKQALIMPILKKPGLDSAD
jgi:hypothetical protein